MFCTFWLGNVLRASSRHNGVHFFISHLASWRRTRRFSEPTLRPAGATNQWKKCFATFLPSRAPGSSFFWDFLFLSFFLLFFSSLTLPISAFHLSILSEVWLLNFLRSYLLFISRDRRWLTLACLGRSTWISTGGSNWGMTCAHSKHTKYRV